jgi:hypothetical protein
MNGDSTMVRKILALLVTLMILCSVAAFAEEVAPQNTPKVVIDVSQADADGYFTAKFIIYNAVYKGFICSLNYNIEAVAPIDFETKQPTTDFLKFAKKPTVAKNLETGEAIENWSNDGMLKIDDKAGLINFSNFLNTKQPMPNSIVTKNKQILAPEAGLVVYEFNFKKLADKPFDFKLATSVKANPTGFMLVSGSGLQAYTFEIKLSDANAEQVKFEPKTTTKVSDTGTATDEEKEKRVQGRTNGVIFLYIGNYATVSDSKLKWVDKDNKAVMPYIKDSRTLVPLRYIAEELGAKVSYNEETKEITIKTMASELVLTVGKKEYTNDGVKKQMDTPAEIIEGRTFVPVRVISEDLNKAIYWSEKDKMVVITPKEYIWAEENEIEKELLNRVQMLVSPLIRDMAY